MSKIDNCKETDTFIAVRGRSYSGDKCIIIDCSDYEEQNTSFLLAFFDIDQWLEHAGLNIKIAEYLYEEFVQEPVPGFDYRITSEVRSHIADAIEKLLKSLIIMKEKDKLIKLGRNGHLEISGFRKKGHTIIGTKSDNRTFYYDEGLLERALGPYEESHNYKVCSGIYFDDLDLTMLCNIVRERVWFGKYPTPMNAEDMVVGGLFYGDPNSEFKDFKKIYDNIREIVVKEKNKFCKFETTSITLDKLYKNGEIKKEL